MDEVDNFIEKLLNDKGITDVDPETRESLRAEMRERLISEIDKAAIIELSEEKAQELGDLIDKNPDLTNEEVSAFFQDSGVNLTQVALDTMLKFRGFYLGTEE